LGDKLACFVPAHPIAGKEVAGIEHADARLYQDRRTILTPLSSNSMRHTKLAHDIWSTLGSHVSTMTATDHDQTFAAVSHLPHLLAFAAVHALTTHPQGADYLDMAGPGFRDFSRIAASDPAVWRDILSANRTEVLAQLAHFQSSLALFEAAMQSGDTTGLQQLIQQASDVRSSWALQSGPAQPGH